MIFLAPSFLFAGTNCKAQNIATRPRTKPSSIFARIVLHSSLWLQCALCHCDKTSFSTFSALATKHFLLFAFLLRRVIFCFSGGITCQ